MATRAEQYSSNAPLQTEDGLKMIEQVRPGKNCKVLDLGCGTGYLTSVLAEAVGLGGQVIGVDPDKERIRIAQEKYSASNLVFQEGSDEGFPEDQYDIIFMNYVFHWIKDQDQESLFKKVYENLKPGGCFAFTVPLRVPPLLDQISDWMDPDRPRINEFWCFLPFEAYEKMAVQSGFSVMFKSGPEIAKVITFPNIKAVIDWWFATTNGVFDPSLIDAVTLDGFVKPFGDKPVQFEQERATFILSKHS